MKKISNRWAIAFCFGLTALCSTATWAQVVVSDAWARSTVPAQTATGVFMNITAKQATQLVGAESPVAQVVEVHEMNMTADTMSMKPVKSIAIKAGERLELKPGSYHIMLLDLKQKPLKVGEIVPIKLKLQGTDGKITTQDVAVEVRGFGSKAAPPNPHEHMHH